MIKNKNLPLGCHKEIDFIIETEEKLSQIEIKKTASSTTQLTNVFKMLDGVKIERGNVAVVCMKEGLMKRVQYIYKD